MRWFLFICLCLALGAAAACTSLGDESPFPHRPGIDGSRPPDGGAADAGAVDAIDGGEPDA